LASWRRFLPWPFELAVYGTTAVVVLVLRAHGLRLDGRTVEYMADALLPRLPGLLLLGVGLRLAAHLARWRSPLPWLRAAARPAALLLWARLWLALLVLTYAYTWLKVSVPFLRLPLYDAGLWALDRALHLGISPSLFAAELVAGTPVARWLDLWYALWLTSVLAVQSYAFLAVEPERRRSFALACALLWLTGVWIYVLLPAAGPCFYTRDAFAAVLDQMPNARLLQEKLWGHYLQLVAGREGAVYQVRPFLAVAAMPSLHVGAHALFFFWFRRHRPRLAPLFALATALTFLGSLATGWHYAVDGYAGILLAWGAVRLADRLEPLPGAEAAGAQRAEERSSA